MSTRSPEQVSFDHLGLQTLLNYNYTIYNELPRQYLHEGPLSFIVQRLVHLKLYTANSFVCHDPVSSIL